MTEVSTRSEAEIRLRELMSSEFFAPPQFDALKAALRNQFVAFGVRVDDAAPWGPGNRVEAKAVLVVGPSRAGKTTAVRQALAELEPLTIPGGEWVAPTPIVVECSSEFAIEGLWRQMLSELKYPTTRNLHPNQLFQRIVQRLPKVRPTVLVIEEYAYTFEPAKVGPNRIDKVRREIQGQFRALMDDPIWPTPLVLVGTEELLAPLAQHHLSHVRQKIEDVIRIDSMLQGSNAEIALLHEAFDAYCGHAGLAAPFGKDDDIWRRLIHACGLRRGLALEMVKEVVIDGWRAGRPLDRDLFIDCYRRRTGAELTANPFFAPDWHLTDPTKFFEVTAASEGNAKRRQS